MKKLQHTLTAPFSSILGSWHPLCTGKYFLRQLICILYQLPSKTCKKCSGGDFSNRPFGQGTQTDITNFKNIPHGLVLWRCWRLHSNGYWYRYVFKNCLIAQEFKSNSSYTVYPFFHQLLFLSFHCERVCLTLLIFHFRCLVRYEPIFAWLTGGNFSWWCMVGYIYSDSTVLSQKSSGTTIA